MNTTVPCELIGCSFGMVMVPSLHAPPRVFVTVQHNGMPREVFEGIYQERSTSSLPDIRTLPLALELFRHASPHVGVISHMFHRHFLETNVPPEDAYRDPRMEAYYQAFHAEIDQRLTAAAAIHGSVLLLDLHGFIGQPDYAPKPHGYDAILGTGNRRTVRFKERGPDSIASPADPSMADIDYQLRDALQKQGLVVFCPEYEPLRERRWRERVKKSFLNAEIVPRNMFGEDEMEDGLVEPPHLPDRYNGGYVIRRHTETLADRSMPPRVAAGIQIEVAASLRGIGDGDIEEGRDKRQRFICATAELIKRMCV